MKKDGFPGDVQIAWCISENKFYCFGKEEFAIEVSNKSLQFVVGAVFDFLLQKYIHL